MKIALTGPSGSGKTTISQFIKQITGLPYMSMSAGDILSDQDKEYLHNKYGYRNEGHKHVIQLSNIEPEFGKDFQKAVALARYNKIVENSNFIIDRCPIDNLAYFLLQCSHNCTVKDIDNFITVCKKGLEELDIVIFCHSKAEVVEDNNSRVDNKYYQRMTERVFQYAQELLLTYPKPSIYHLDTWDLEEKEMLIRSIMVDAGVTINNNKHK